MGAGFIKESIKILRSLLQPVSPKDKFMLWVYGASSALVAVLDVVALGVAAIIMTSLMTSSRIVLPILGTINERFVPTLLATVLSLMLIKNIALVIFSALILRRVRKIETFLGSRIFEKYLGMPWALRSGMPSVEILRVSDFSVAKASSNFLYPLLLLPGLFASCLAMVIALLIIQPLTAFLTIGFFGLVGVALHIYLTPKSSASGAEEQISRNHLSRMMLEMLDASKELILRGSLGEAMSALLPVRTSAANSSARYGYLAGLPRPVLEMALLVGVFLVGFVNYVLGGWEACLSAIGLFGLAGFRLTPALSALQANLVSISVGKPYAMNVAEENIGKTTLGNFDHAAASSEEFRKPFDIKLENVTFSYPGSKEKALKQVSLEIPAGSRIAIVGSSGSGKSTLVDVLLGLLTPTSGHLFINGEDANLLGSNWQQSIGYIPQEVTLFDATVAQNVALKWTDKIDVSAVNASLSKANLDNFIAKLPEGIHSPVGERGFSLSGGQRQRLGIARALYSFPKILIMDEATSSLDSSTEEQITRMIDSLGSSVTIITVAHRLSTIRNYDSICLMEQGAIVATGTFDQLVQANEAFEKQARLSGILT